MSMVEAVKSVFGQYATFTGRARRSEYWYFTLFNFLVSLVISVLWAVILRGEGSLNFLSGIWTLATFVPSLAVSIRRLHDTGKSGWYCLISLIPLAGAIILIVFLATDSQPGTNQYGPNPKGM